jgi:integrase
VSSIVKGRSAGKPYSVRFRDPSGASRERAFATLAEARAFKTDADHAARYGNPVDTRAARGPFGELALAWIAAAPVGERSRDTYRAAYSKHVASAFAGRTLAQVAGDRDAVTNLLNVTIAHLSIATRTRVRMVIVATLDEAVKAGKIAAHRCGGIALNSSGQGREVTARTFTYAGRAQTDAIAERAGIAVQLMRWCGLRIQEALAVERSDFRDGGAVLRVSGQATRDGRSKVALKKRQPGQYRDVPVPAHLRAMVAALPDGPVQPGRGRRFEQAESVRGRFMRAAAAAGLAGTFTPHAMRHAWVSDLLTRGVPITVVAQYAGHRDVRVTYAVYGHLLPSSSEQVVTVLDRAAAA